MTPLWVAELSPAKSRGRLVSVEGNLIAFGIVIAYFFNIGMPYLPASNPAEWRVPVAFQAVFIIPQIALVWLLPESPRWLAKRRSSDCLTLETESSTLYLLVWKANVGMLMQAVATMRPWTSSHSCRANLRVSMIRRHGN